MFLRRIQATKALKRLLETGRSTMADLALLLLAMLALTTSTLAACPSNYAAAGFSAPLTTIDHAASPDLLLPCRPLTPNSAVHAHLHAHLEVCC